MSLVKILREMEENRPNSEMVLTMENPNTHGAKVGLKRSATEALLRLRTEYRKELLASTVFIITTGTAKDQFTELASNEIFDCFSADPEEFYKDIASRIDPTLYKRESIRHLYNIAGNILEDKCLELDIISFPMLMFSEKYNIGVTNAEEFAASLKNSINDQVGSEIVGINAVNSIVDLAIKRNHSAKVTPLVLNTSDEKLALDLLKNLKRLTPRTFLVVAGKSSKELKDNKEVILVKNVTEDTVGEALTSIRNKIL